MRAHRAGDQPRCAGSDAELARRRDGRLDDLWVIGESQVVVGTQRQHRTPADNHPGVLRAIDGAQGTLQPGCETAAAIVGKEIVRPHGVRLIGVAGGVNAACCDARVSACQASMRHS